MGMGMGMGDKGLNMGMGDRGLDMGMTDRGLDMDKDMRMGNTPIVTPIFKIGVFPGTFAGFLEHGPQVDPRL